ncbi:hypothetical protein HMPREF9306_00594 [Propionimicrobium lymphophilum ACS-093-V-SCH5]|uniref:Uncharacterized protein n=1 Tax=Propionimicrobium lymphophilum ACS-093-V-SCH5 TaxID=883161 RepID=S2W422_9ACTN|nr:hypothetical protein [Propionimicrobium lymphophilum]EPD33065.1 hypothetical protein HMPREF9306_00594 [Propionimicrobium lymphophilum ACS-093-V-SCH5]
MPASRAACDSRDARHATGAGLRTLLVDLDPQASATDFFGLYDRAASERRTSVELLYGDEAFARVWGFLCDAAAISACYREHVGPPSKPLKSQIRDLQRALGRAEVPGVPDELARLLAQEKEEGAEDGARKVKEDWGDVDEEAW